MKPRALACLVELAAFLAAPVILLAMPTSVVESGPTLCLFKGLSGHNCPGCGTTRAFSCVMHGQFAAAWKFNRLVAVTFPLACWLWVLHVRRLCLGLTVSWRRRTNAGT